MQLERQLNLILALDKARDAINGDPSAMFRAVVRILKDYFTADACAVMTLSENGDEVESLTTLGVSGEVALELCQQAARQTQAAPLSTDAWPHTVGMAIIQDENNSRLGGFFLARQSTPFSDDEIALLRVGESQIDSAVMQARMVWNLAHHNIQLEAIYQIDRMRDTNPTESELITGFNTIVAEHFSAELCLVFLTHVDSGEMLLRGVLDKANISPEALATIRDLSGDIVLPQTIQTPTEMNDLALLAAPLVSGGIKLGSVVVGRRAPFTVADHRLLYAMVSQMDSAIAHGRIMQQLQQRTKELETIYQIDHIRDTEPDFDKMLARVLQELTNAVNSEMGYLTLYKNDGQQTRHQAITTSAISTSPIYAQAINRASDEALRTGKEMYSNKPDGAVRSIVAIPLILNDRILGVFGTVNSVNPRGFNEEDRRMLKAITSQVDTAIFEGLERRRMRKVLSRSVDPKVLEHLLQRADEALLTGERVVLTTLFADLRGSTEWAERTHPEELVNTLNQFLGKMTDVIFEFKGTLDKFVGDEVIALFGSPVSMTDHALKAMRCALKMQECHRQLQTELSEKGVFLPPMGIGISSGEVIAGEFGPPIRTDFTAMGSVMNLGSRLCGVAGAGQIIISQTTYEMAQAWVEVQETVPTALKGLGEVRAYELLKVVGDAE
ncbi:MAG: hypothetical protein OHK0046_03280 [Anaerolineae bacterium]